MARQMAFQRKGAPSSPNDTSDNEDEQDTPDDANAGDASKQNEDDETAVCPNCDCKFDDETGDVIKPGKPVVGGNKDYSPDGKGGPDLALPGVNPDPQAPAGMDAITMALASALGKGQG